MTRLSVKVGINYSGYGTDDFWGFVDTIEDAGWDSLWLADSPQLGGLAPLPTLAAVAARTDKLKLGVNVLVLPHRNPLVLARELATVDALSGGRMLPAGGLGAPRPSEIEAMGVPRGERAARMEECIEIMRRLWSGETVTHEGRFHTLHDIALTPKPVNPAFEFWLGGRAPVALKRIGRMADGWLGSFVGPEEFGEMVQLIRDTAAEHGRTIDEDHYGTTIFAAPSEDEVPRGLLALLKGGRDDLPREDHVAIGPDELRALLWRFREQGGTKFVVVPAARDIGDWSRRMRDVVEPFEAEA